MVDIPEQTDDWTAWRKRTGIARPPVNGKKEEKDEWTHWREKAVRQQAENLNLILEEGRRFDPNDAVRILRLSTRTGLHPDLVASDLDRLEKEVEQQGFDPLKNIHVFNWLIDSPQYAALTHEDIRNGKIQNIDRLIKMPKEQWPLTDEQVVLLSRRAADRRARAWLRNTILRLEVTEPTQALKDTFFEDELRKRRRTEAFISGQERVGFTEEFRRQIRFPFLGAAAEAFDDAAIYRASMNMEAGVPSEEDVDLLVSFGRMALAEERRGRNAWGVMGASLASIIEFGVEFAFTKGTFPAGKMLILKGGQKAGEKFLRKAVRKALAYGVGTGAQTLAMSSSRIIGGVFKRQTPWGAVEVSGPMISYTVIPKTGEPFGIALYKSVVDAWAEIASERAGTLLRVLDKPLNKALFGWWLTKHTGATANAFQTAIQKGGIHGILGEFSEERLSDLIRHFGGVSPFRWPTLEEAAGEALAFAVPSAVSAASTRVFAPRFPGVANKEAFKRLGGIVAELKIQQVPETSQGLLKRIVTDTKIEYVYAPIDVWDAYWKDKKDKQGNPVDIRDLARELTGDPKAYDNAVTTGQDLQIPTEKWLSLLGATEHNEFWQNELRFDPQELNNREAKEFVVRQAERLATEPLPELTTEKPALSPVGQEVVKQIEKAGISPKLAADYAQLADVEIRAAETETSTEPLFPDPSAVGMSESEAKKYTSAILDSRKAIQDTLASQLIERFQRGQTKEFIEEGKKIKPEIEREINESREYTALSILQTGKMPDGGEVPDAQADLKLQISEIEKQWGRVMVKALPKGILTKKGGVHPDDAAEKLGFVSGDELLNTLSGLEEKQSLIERLTNERLTEIHGPPVSEELLRDMAVQAIHLGDQSKRLHAELQWLASEKFAAFKGLVRTAALPVPALEQFTSEARDAIRDMRVRAIKPGLFQRAEGRAGRDAVNLFLKGAIEEAFLAKKQQIFNHELFKEASKAVKNIPKIVKFMRRFEEENARQALGKAGADYLEVMDGLLSRFGFARAVSARETRKRESLVNWIERRKERGLPIPPVPEKLLQEAYRVNYQDLFYDELLSVHDTAKSIHHFSTLKNKLLNAKKEREFDEAVTRAIASIEENFKGKKKAPEIETRLPQYRLWKQVGRFMASQIKLSSFARQMDGFKLGVMSDLLTFPLDRASDVENSRKPEEAKRLHDLFSIFKPSERLGWYNKEQIPGVPQPLTKMGQIMVFLNSGNEDSATKLRAGYGWTEAQHQAILNNLAKKQADFGQSVLDQIGKFWPEIAALHKRVTGLEPEKVMASPIRTPHGVYPGGYFPLEVDWQQAPLGFDVPDPVDEAKKRGIEGRSIFASTRHGHRLERVKGVRLPLRLDPGVIFDHYREVIHDLAFYETLLDLRRLLVDERLSSAIINHYGIGVYEQLVGTIEDVAMGERPARTGFEAIMDWFRKGSSIAYMAWSASVTLLQPTGVFVAKPLIGWKNLGEGTSRFLSSAVGIENTVKWIHDNVPLMRNRARNQMRETNEILNRIALPSRVSLWADLLGEHLGKIIGKKGPEVSMIGQSFFWPITRAQLLADNIVWLGGYITHWKKTHAPNTDAELDAMEIDSIEFANRIVRETQGTGDIHDLAQIQRGGPLMKLWTNFYGYFNLILQRMREAGIKVTLNPAEVGRLAGDILVLIAIPATLDAVIRATLRGELDDEDFLKKVLIENLAYATGTIVGVREIGGAVRGFPVWEGPPGARVISSISRLSRQLMQVKADPALFRALNETAGIVFHYPALQLDRTFRGLVSMTKGDTANPGVLFLGPTPKRKGR